MGIKQKVLNLAIEFIKYSIYKFGTDRGNAIAIQLVEKISPVSVQATKFGTLNFFCPSALPEWRAKTLLTKEPETIEWIESFCPNDVFWDIGANVGVYSLYAALKKIKVVSFEPAASNYYLLCKNIEINKMDDLIYALCIAFNDTTKLDSFYMANTDLGAALNSFAEAIDWQGNSYDVALKQAMIGFNIDDFVKQFNPPFPNHIKIDVDGIEDKIIKGAKNTLSNKRLKSILVELDSNRPEYCNNVISRLENAGLKLREKKHGPMFDKGKFSKLYNYFFYRKN